MLSKISVKIIILAYAIITVFYFILKIAEIREKINICNTINTVAQNSSK